MGFLVPSNPAGDSLHMVSLFINYIVWGNSDILPANRLSQKPSPQCQIPTYSLRSVLTLLLASPQPPHTERMPPHFPPETFPIVPLLAASMDTQSSPH